MKTLIFYAHPSTPGHCPVILEEVLNYLQQNNQEYELFDLYKINYDPVLHDEEHYTANRREISTQNKEIQQKITDTKRLIFIYPVWWSSMPAIMKGFLDRILTARFAFTYKGRIPVKLLKGRKAKVFITSGAPNFFSWLLFGNRPKKIIKNDTLEFCGIKTSVYQLGNCAIFNEKRIKKIKRMVPKALARW